MQHDNKQKAPLKVCHCLISGGFGGIERQVHSLAEVQSKQVRVGVIFAMSGGPFAEEIDNLESVSTLTLGLKNGFDLNPAAVLKARKFMMDYDLVHMHSLNYVVIFAALMARKKTVYTFHGLTHLRRELNIIDKLKFKTLKIFSENLFYRLTTVSLFMRKEIVEKVGVKKKIHVVPNSTPELPATFVDQDFLRNKMGAQVHDMLVLTYSRIVHNKRIDMLLEAAKILKDRDVTGIQFTIIGEGAHKPVLVRKMQDYDLESLVSFLPFKKNIFDYIRAANVCVFPSHLEPFGIVALEAMALYKPVIVMRDGGGLVEVVKPVREGGYVVESVEDMAEKIQSLAENHDILSRDGKAFYLRAEDFQPAKIAKQYQKIYSFMCSPKHIVSQYEKI